MSLDDLQFSNDEDRRKYLSDLARLKRIREEEKNINMRLDSYNNRKSIDDIDVPKFMNNRSNSSYNYYEGDDEYYENGEYYDDEYYEDPEYELQKKGSSKLKSEKSNKEKNAGKSKKNANASSKANGTKNIDKNKNAKHKNNINNTPPKKKKRKFIILLNIFLLALIGIALYFAYLFLNAKETGFYTVAVFGVDSRDGNLGKGALADVNMLAHINRETGEIKLISLYRDTYSEIDGKGTYHKLNEAYFKGGPDQALATLKRNFDIEADDYATVNWKAVVDGINILGGIDLEITKSEFKYINSFITETVNSTGVGSHHLKSAGMQHLDGVQAVAYARLRLMDTDFNRTERQRKVVSLAFEKLKKADIGTINNILVTVFPQVSTSISLNDIIPMARNANKYHLGETTGFPFEKDTKKINKRDFVIPISLKNNVIALHKFLYGENISYSPSNEVKQISATIIKNTGIGDDSELSDIEIKKDTGITADKNSNIKSDTDTTKENTDTTKKESDASMEGGKEISTTEESDTSDDNESEASNNKETTQEPSEDENIINEEENDDWMSRHHSTEETTTSKARIVENKDDVISNPNNNESEIGPGVNR